MNNVIYSLENSDDKYLLFQTDDILASLNLQVSDILAFYRQKAKYNSNWEYCKDLYLTNKNIIIVELKDGINGGVTVKLIPLKNFEIDESIYSFSTREVFRTGELSLKLEDINLGDELEGIIEKPQNIQGHVSFQNNYLDFKRKLSKCISEKKE